VAHENERANRNKAINILLGLSFQPMFYCPISQNHNAGEIARIRKECKKESFWYRACLSPRG
uniref:Uncharacterized protein n=1 Tax=Strix occidentalis caurina TaxID=311401 RepID=A0A8D0FH31_STROC